MASTTSMATVHDGEQRSNTIDPDSDNIYAQSHYNKEPRDHASGVNHTGALDDVLPSPTRGSRAMDALLGVGTFLLFAASIAGLAGGAALLQSVSGQSWSCSLLNELGGIVVGVSVLFLVNSLCYAFCAVRRGPQMHASACARNRAGSGPLLCCSVTNLVLLYVFVAVAIVLALLGFSFSRLNNVPVSTGAGGVRASLAGGNDGAITVWRDAATNFPHIHAASQGDAFYAQGYLHAEDRLWEVEFMRLVIHGKLASRVGKAAVKIDKQTRTLGMGAAALAMCEAASARTKALYQRYADGLNHFVKTRTERPVEFAFMGKPGESFASIIPGVRLFSYYEPDPFVYSDVCSAAKLIQFEMAGDANSEAKRFSLWWTNPDRSRSDIDALWDNFTNYSYPILTSAQMNISAEDIEDEKRRRYATQIAEEQKVYSQIFGPARDKHAANIKRLYGQSSAASSSSREASVAAADSSVDAKGSSPASSSSSSSSSSSWWGSSFSLHTQLPEWDIFAVANKYSTSFASNGWVARGFDGVAGGASDPHLQNTLPSVWYAVRLSWGGTPDSPRLAATGVSLAGMPSLGVFRRDVFNLTTGQCISTLANAITSLQTDYEDLFVLNMTGKLTYSLDDGATTATLIEEAVVIDVLGQGEPEKFTLLRSSIYGNDVTDVFFEDMQGNWGTPGGAAPFRFFMYSTVFLPAQDNTSADAFADTLDESVLTAAGMRMNVASRLYSPAFSIPIFDGSNTVVYSCTGRHWERNTWHSGRWPTFAFYSTDRMFKQFSIPYDELPGIVLPVPAATAGLNSSANWAMVATANQKVYPDGYRYDLGAGFDPGYRAAWVQTTLRSDAHRATAGHISAQVAAQTVITSGMWYFAVQPQVVKNKQCFVRPAAAASSMTAAQSAAWDAAKGWLAESIGLAQGTWPGEAAVGTFTIGFFWRTMQELSTIFSPVVQTLNKFNKNAVRAPSGDSYFHKLLVLQRALEGRAPSFVQNELCAAYLARRGFANGAGLPDAASACGNNTCMQALVVALLTTAQRYPSTTSAALSWGYGIKVFENQNRMMSSSPFSCMFDRTYAKDGDVTTPDVSDFSLASANFKSVVSSSMRQVYSTNAPRSMLFSLPGGVSGHPYSKYYTNFLDTYLADKYFNLTLF